MSGEMMKSEFVQSVESALKAANTVHVFNIFQDNKNEHEVQNNSWDLIPIVAQYLTQSNELNNNKVFHCCEKLLDFIATRSNAEETLLQLIEEIEECKDERKFYCLLPCLKKVLFRLPLKRVSSLAWGFNAVQHFLNQLDLPDDSNLAGKENLTLYDDNLTILRALEVVLEFYSDFTEELLQSRNEFFEERAAVLVKFLIQLLGQPLCFFDLNNYDLKIKFKPRKIAERLLNLILSLQSDPFSIIEAYFSKAESNELIKPHLLGIAVLIYLIQGEHFGLNQIPQVYDNFYKFQICLPLCTELFQTESNRGAEKALKLALNLLNFVQNDKLSYLVLDSPNHSKFSTVLCNVIIYNQVEQIRKNALKVFDVYLSSFDAQGFYLLLMNLLSNLNHGGLLGFVIIKYKEYFANEMNKQQSMSIYCKDEKLLKILKQIQSYFFSDEKMDLVQFSDVIISALNFLRFALMRDKENLTGIWNWVNLFEENYWNRLRKAIELSRAHYELRIKQVNEGSDWNNETEVSVNVCGQMLEELPKEEKLKVLNSSLTAFDMIDCILSRLIEFVDANKNC